MLMTQYKQVALELKQTEEGIIYGHASVKNNVDKVGDVIIDGAYKDLGKSLKTGFTCINHEHKKLPVGYLVKLEEDTEGLYFEAKFHSTKEGQEAYTVIKERLDAGLDVYLSIGYKTLKYSFGEYNDLKVRFLEEIFVKEVTFTLFPANEAAEVMGMKTRDQELTEILDACVSYNQRLQEIKALGRGESFDLKAREDIESINVVLEEIKSSLESFQEKQADESLGDEAEEQKTEQDENLELNLAKAKAQAILTV
jgi:HK97 family phage prohead protease